MAIQEKNGMLRGKAGSVIFRKWRGLNVVQGLPRKGKQTLATKAAAIEFGRASATAARLRKSMGKFYQQADLGMANRLTRQVLRAIQQSPGRERLDRDMHDADLSHIQGFEFNSNTKLSDALPVLPTVSMRRDGSARVSIPAFLERDIRYSVENKQVSAFRLRIIAMAYNFREGFCELLKLDDIPVQCEQNAIEWTFDGAVPNGMIVLIGMALYAEQHYRGERMLLNSQEWSPAAILNIQHVSDSELSSMSIEEKLEAVEKHGQASPLSGLGVIEIQGDTRKFREAYWGTLRRKPLVDRVLVEVDHFALGRILLE